MPPATFGPMACIRRSFRIFLCPATLTYARSHRTARRPRSDERFTLRGPRNDLAATVPARGSGPNARQAQPEIIQRWGDSEKLPRWPSSPPIHREYCQDIDERMWAVSGDTLCHAGLPEQLPTWKSRRGGTAAAQQADQNVTKMGIHPLRLRNLTGSWAHLHLASFFVVSALMMGG